jgi:hypothetical protein
VAASGAQIADRQRQADQERRIAWEAEDAEWRRRFRPLAIIQTERTVPNQITFFGMMGGAGRWLTIPLDDSQPPVTFVQQTLGILPEKLWRGSELPYFGKAIGFVINYSPTKALRCEFNGEPLEVLPKAYRPGQVRLWTGPGPFSPILERPDMRLRPHHRRFARSLCVDNAKRQ